LNEALPVSIEEGANLITILHKIDAECRHIDTYTQEIMLTLIDSLLKYSDRVLRASVSDP
jgi:hypothetical protein